jgi:hypothetical protein
MKGVNLGGPIVLKNEYKQIAYAPVLVPGEEDFDGDILTKEEIEEYSHEWMENYKNIDSDHAFNNAANVVESYITPYDLTVEIDGKETVIPQGSWVMGAKVYKPEVWADIVSGKKKGFSITAFPKSTKRVDNVEKGRTTLQDLKQMGNGIVVTHVSIVDEPAVPKARFFTLKSKEDNLIKRLSNIFKSQEEAKKLEDFIVELESSSKKGVDNMDEQKVMELITQALQPVLDVVNQLQEKVNTLEGSETSNEEVDATAKSEDGVVEPAAEKVEEAPVEQTTEENNDLTESILNKVKELIESKLSVKSKPAPQSKVIDTGVAQKGVQTVVPDRDIYGRPLKK